jgi:hypothetical protein
MKVTTKQTDSRWIFKVYEGDKYRGEIRVPRFSTPEQIQTQAEKFAWKKANERLTKAFGMTF